MKDDHLKIIKDLIRIKGNRYAWSQNERETALEIAEAAYSLDRADGLVSLNHPTLTVQEAAAQYLMVTLHDDDHAIKNGFIAGANHILASGEYVSVRELEKLFNDRIADLQEMQLSKLEAEHVINEDEYMLMKIQKLKNAK